MKTTDKKAEFIELRAQGLSYSKIAAQLHISKGTCTNWERELKAQIQELKADKLGELYTLYAMDRESRIKRVGDALQRIDGALEQKDLTQIPAGDLLKLKLKYEEQLKGEYTEPTSSSFIEFNTLEVMQALAELYEKQQSGEISPAQAKAQLATLANLLTAEKLHDSQMW